MKEWRVGVSQDEPQEEGERRQTLIFSNQRLSEYRVGNVGSN